MRSSLLLIPLLLSSCAAMESVWDTTTSVFDAETGEVTEVAIGDVVADAVTSDEASGIIGTLLGANPALAAGAGAAAAMLAAAARRKRKAALVKEDPAEDTDKKPEVKG